jgi:hypothetical protein
MDTVVEPQTLDVGTAKLYENDRIIVWEFLLEPGEYAHCHTHAMDYVMYVVEGSRLQTFDVKGEPLATYDAPAGAIIPLNVEGQWLVDPLGLGYRVPVTHSARNVGETRYREILIETKPS